MIETIVVADRNEATSKSGSPYLRITTTTRETLYAFDQALFPALGDGVILDVEIDRSGKFATITAFQEHIPAIGAGTSLAPAAGLTVKDLSIHRQVALKSAVETLGLVGNLGGQPPEDAMAHVLTVAECYRRWLDQEGF